MNYLFDPDNWEWLTTGNNVRFILEGFLINLEIALISMVFALILGLGAGAAAALAGEAGEHPRGRVDRRLPQPAADLPDPVLRARAAGLVEGGVGGRDALVGARGVPVRARAGRPDGAGPLQLGRAGRDHARRHPLAAARARARRPRRWA